MIRKACHAISAAVVLCCLSLAPAGAAEKSKKTDSAQSKSAQTNAKVDINSASEAELDNLPGVGPATARKIISGRPYSSAEDLRKAGVPAKTVQAITPLIVVGTASSPRSAAPSGPVLTPPATPYPPARTQPVPQPTTQPAAQQPSQPGMVWVNIETKVYHRQGHRWYGKTKQGKFMTEADAIKAGYRLSKE